LKYHPADRPKLEMKKFRYLVVRWLCIAAVLNVLSACLASEPEKPGNRSNPKLASLIQDALAKEIALMNPTWAPGLKPSANLVASDWLSQIDEVTSRCRYGPDDFSKSNKLEYDIKLTSGEIIKGINSGMVCQYQSGFGKPLIMKIVFKDGKATNAFTDGREINEPISYSQSWISNSAEKIIRADWKRRPDFYFKENKTKEQIRKEWEK
jgi:hypothetical protein